MAFVPTSTFLGTATLGSSPKPLLCSRPNTQNVNTPTMSESSSVWQSFARSLSAKNAPTVTFHLPVKSTEKTEKPRKQFATLAEMMTDLRRRGYLFRRSNVPPRTSKADAYMANCVTVQYKATACSSGTYGVTCTEGTTRGMAEDTRVMALATQFRAGTRGMIAKYGDLYENRRQAVVACHGCSYEEKLVLTYSKVAQAMLTGESESMGVCVRYANPTNPVEKYMTECVDKQNKFRAVENGLYGVMCQDGSVSGMAEFKRTVALAAKFRAAQLPDIVTEQNKFNARKMARERYAGMCGYEEELFNKYPATGMAMRPANVRY